MGDQQPDNRPDILYHFRDLKYGLLALVNQRLKVARFDNLNDPFDTLLPLLDNREAGILLADAIAEAAASTGLICFSEGWSSPTLWAHYSENHTGLAFGFRIQSAQLYKMQYVERRPVHTIADFIDGAGINEDKLHNLIDHHLKLKFDHWRYEQEWRVFVDLDDPPNKAKLHFKDFDSEMQLAEVILGYKCSTTVEAIRQLVLPDCRVVRARLSDTEYKMEPAGV